MTCRACGRSVDIEASFCPFCGAPRAGQDAPTRPPLDQTVASGGDRDFPPGAVLVERYRIIGRIGQGGMGDVYRADDLVLAQTVALKFLPSAVANYPERLARFRSEVRVARQISHGNVCRVYDIGEAAGHTFLTMEYIDGENLASLLRRIGRLPQDTATEMARQLCAGLAAAHEKGVLHRDLKPANVMIDGTGKVKLADFGLAGTAGEPGVEVLAGTPAYMAPELFDHKAPSTRSDIYALGLVLHEMFTGRPAFQSTSVAELARMHQETTPASVSSIVSDVDATVARVIQRCLAKDPDDRPATALAVATALPGGDPLAAALAAGETPSPEVVAAAGGVGAIEPAVGAACVAAILIGLATVVWLSASTQAVNYAPLDKAPEVLADQARSIIERLGYVERPFDVASGYTNPGYIAYLRNHDPSPRRWENLRVAQPPAFAYWYRQGPQALASDRFGLAGRVTENEPPHAVPGMVLVVVDLKGRLYELVAVPAALHDASVAPLPDWTALLREAGLDPAVLTPTAPTHTPVTYADARAAWDGVHADLPDMKVHVEAAAAGGRPVFFRIYESWRIDANRAISITPGMALPNVVVFVAIFIGALFLARRNLRLSRGDLSSATKLALALCALDVGAGLLRANHSADVWRSILTTLALVARGALMGAVAWITYVALEPDLRRRAPHLFIGWSRLLRGRFGDPLIGRDVLVGVTAATGFQLLFQLQVLAPAWAGQAPAITLPFGGSPVGTMRELVAMMVNEWVTAVLIATTFLLLFVLSLLVRPRWLAWAVFFGALVVLLTLTYGVSIPLLFALGTLLVMTLVVARFGLLAFVVMNYVSPLLDHVPMTFDPGRWYGPQGWLVLAVVIGLTAFGYRAAVAKRSLPSPVVDALLWR